MPPSIVNLGSSANPDINLTTNINNYSGSSWTPPTTGLLVVDVHSAQTSGNPPIPIPQGNNLTFYQIQSVLFGSSGGQRLTRFGANLTGSITGITGFTFTGSSQLCCRASFYYVSGTTVDLTNGVTGSFVQSPTNSATTGVTGSVALSAAGNSANRVIFAVSHLANELHAPKSGWTELDDFGGTAPATDISTQFRDDAFDTDAYATWSTSAAWGAIASEIKAVVGATTYNLSVSVSRLESVSDQMTNNISPSILISQKDGMSDGMNNSIPKNSSLNEVLTITDNRTVGVFPILTLLEILTSTSRTFANMQGSVGLGDLVGLSGDPNTTSRPQATLIESLGLNISGGLTLLSSLLIAEKMGFSVLGNVGVYKNVNVGERLAFVPANIALIGGSVSIGQAMGLIDVPRLDAQAALVFLEREGIFLSSALSSQTVQAILTLAEKLGISEAAQLKSYPLVGIGERLFLVESNNANMFGRNALSEIRAVSVLGGLSIQKSVVIPIDLDILTSKLLSIFKTANVGEKLGLSDSAVANMQAAINLGEKSGMGNAVNQILNAGLSISVVGSVLTISGINVIIVKGFVFTSDSSRDSVSSQDSSNTVSTSDTSSSVETGDS